MALEEREREQLMQELRDLRGQFLHGTGRHLGDPWMDLDLTISQVRTIFCLSTEPGVRMSDLATQLGITLPAATSLVNRLVRGGLVERRPDPSDRRVVRCALSSEGAALVQRLHEGLQMAQESLLSRLTIAELRVVVEGMRTLHRAAARIAEERDRGRSEAPHM